MHVMSRLGRAVLLAFGLVAVVAATAAAHPEPNDVDGDGVLNERDNCVDTRNADQRDFDGDGAGDRCDADADNDGHANNLPYLDGGADNCPLAPNPDQKDDGPEGTPDNGIGDACDRDSDGDTVTDVRDNCPDVANRGQDDYDYDRTGDVCDPDDDQDGEFDAVDNCPLVYNYDQADGDGDGRGTACDDEAGGGPAPPGALDREAPAVALRLAAPLRVGALGAGLPVRVRCSEGCAISARLTVDRAAARRLRVGRRATTVAAGTAALGDRGTTYVFMRFKRGMARRLSRGPAVRATLVVTAADEAGNRRTAERRLRIRR
jgi:hypothetical protein